MEIKPIVTKADHRAALKEIEALMPARLGTPEGDRLDVLVTLVEAWEEKRYPMEPPDPIEAIKFRMDQSGLGPKDLVPMIGQLNRAFCEWGLADELAVSVWRWYHFRHD